MTFDEFDIFVREIWSRCIRLGETKGVEYALSNNRLQNFYDVAKEVNIPPLKVWQIYIKKHLRAIDFFINHGETLSESIESRFIDAILYLLLGYALVKETESFKNPLELKSN